MIPIREAPVKPIAGGASGSAPAAIGEEAADPRGELVVRVALSPFILFMALAVGIGFGFYPAWSAARLGPMEALRHG